MKRLKNNIKKNGKPGWLFAFLSTLIPPLQLAIFFVLEIEAVQTERRTESTYHCKYKFQIKDLLKNN